LRRKTAFSIDNLLKESGYSEKTIEEIFKYYGQHKKKNEPKCAVMNLD
jgi:predicted Ser/Thr protein kinase